jgi:hypothetical protein
MREGGSLSRTVTVKEQVDLLPEESVAVAVTVVVPTRKDVPEAGSDTIVTSGEFSVTVGAG